jgi:hypothetical protein
MEKVGVRAYFMLVNILILAPVIKDFKQYEP